MKPGGVALAGIVQKGPSLRTGDAMFNVLHPMIGRARVSLTVLILSFSLGPAGCVVGAEPTEPLDGDAPSPAAEEITADNWREHLRSPDPAVRFLVAEAITTEAGGDGAAALERLASTDPDLLVRERAIVSYGDRLGPEALPFLQDLALKSQDDVVVSAALGAIHRLSSQAGSPQRGQLEVEVPDRFAAGQDFDVEVTLGSAQDVSEARFELVLPRSITPVEADGARWSGSLLAGQPEHLSIRLHATESVPKSGIRAILHLEYGEKFDFEVLKRSYRVWTDPHGGHLAGTPDAGTSLELSESALEPRAERRTP